jgi:LacI family transcriptional regulator
MSSERKHVTLFDICRKAGVSSATVSRVINNSPLVQSTTRKKVLRAIQDLGYRPSHAARMLARQRTDTIGVIFPDIASGFYAEVLSGLDSVAAERQLHILTAFSHGGKDAQALIARFADERRVDAVVFMNLSGRSDAFLRQISKSGLPLVLLDRPVQGLHTVAIDNASGAESVIEHLARLGHRSIAFLKGPDDNYDAAQRLQGVMRGLRKAGLELPPWLSWSGDFTEEGGRAAVTAFLASGAPMPDAIFACNDAMAVGVLAVLQENGLQVPDDVALVGFDDIASARHLGLTTVRSPMREMGRQAGQVAAQLAAGQDPGQELWVMPTDLAVRRSCGAALTRQT